MQLSLNVYKKDNKKEVEKVVVANEFDIMFGTVEDLVALIDVDKLDGEAKDIDLIAAVAKLLSGGMGKVKEVILDIFPDLTEEELRRTKAKELISVVVAVLKYGFTNMENVGSKN